MPEAQVLNAFRHQVQQTLENAYREEGGLWPEGVIRLFPRTFAEGTAAKSHDTITVDLGDYSPSLEPIPVAINPHDLRRIPKRASWRYLLDRELVPGPVHVAIRGKCLAMTAGYHTIVCHFGLEGNLRPMKRADFEEMVKTCVPGNNASPAKARRLRSFPLPSKFIEPGARKKMGHKINILAAVVMEEDVIIVTDFSRMAQVHIISSSRFFKPSDVRPGSMLWNTRLWARFRGGPDWNIERKEALEGLDAWRASVLDAHLLTPIIDVLLDVAGPAAGVGQHLANDLLYCLALHPDTPSFDICSNDETYGELRTFLPQFMSTFASPTFLSRCAGLPNSDNPFIFNEVSNTHFLQGYVLVYRTLEVRMEVDLYNRYQRRGLFDPEHTIGEPYHGVFTPATGEWKVVKVQMFEASQNSRYHVILARPPHTWNAITESTPFKDVSTAGFSTTLGPASFFEPMQNKPDVKELRLVHPGQPRKERTGKRGRPRKAPTLRSIKRLMATPRSTPHQDATSRKRKREDKENEEPTRRKTRSQGNVL